MWGLNIFREIIGIKIQISISKILPCKNSYQIETGQLVSIAYKRYIYNQVEHLQWSFFAKVVNGLD